MKVILKQIHTAEMETLTFLVRTPLNHIINPVEVALDGDLDESTQGHLESPLTASKLLVYAINDLLDLTKLENSETVTGDTQRLRQSCPECFKQR
jgi:hypothetical protein